MVSLGAALWAASGYVAAFRRAANAIYEVGEGRPIYKTAAARRGDPHHRAPAPGHRAPVVVTGPVAHPVGDTVGVGGAAVTAWDIAKWPVLVVSGSFSFALLD